MIIIIIIIYIINICLLLYQYNCVVIIITILIINITHYYKSECDKVWKKNSGYSFLEDKKIFVSKGYESVSC